MSLNVMEIKNYKSEQIEKTWEQSGKSTQPIFILNVIKNHQNKNKSFVFIYYYYFSLYKQHTYQRVLL